MDEFKIALRSFIRNELRFDTLTQTLEQVLAQTPEQADALLSLLTSVQNQLRKEDYSALKSKIEHIDEITQFNLQSDVIQEPISEPVITKPKSIQKIDYSIKQVLGDVDSTAVDTLVSKSVSSTTRRQTSVSDNKPLPLPDKEVLKPGVIIRENYRLEEIVGKGGMGVVWKALDLVQYEGKAREPFVAIKFLSADFKQHPDALKALVREFARYKRLSHPNIVDAYELSRTGNTHFMVMEFLNGISLKKFIRNHPNGIQLEKAEPIIRGMADALIYAHRKGIVHLDFKPSNVFYDEKEKLSKVIDFGIARLLDPSERDQTIYDPGGLGALTEPYASYEMLIGSVQDQPDPRDDIYALACVIYQLLCGKHPFNKKTAVVAKHEKLSPEPITHLKRKQYHALLQGLAFERQDRTPTVEDFLEALFRKSFLWF
jgi:hypothetical protein